ncbi:MAG: SRPBCC family protein, partial [Actinobacteria bacterium]|nr:SRPBCC family protein [Actinomycetota bacterium]
MSIARHVYRIHIKAPIDRVWNALVDPDFTRRYFHDTAFDSPPRAGQPYRTSMSDGRGAVDGTIEVLEPPHRLVMTWHTLYDPDMVDEPPSRVEWTLTEAGPGLTQLDLVHGDLARSPLTWARVRDGWVWIIDALKTLLETDDDLPAPTIESPTVDDPAGEWHRAQAVECNNAAWEMIEAERTPANDEEMLRRAYASAYHWQRASGRGPEHEARALYMLAKAHLLAGHADTSLGYADRCMDQCRRHGLVDFDLAYAHEARSRALHALGRADEAASEWAAARAVPIADDEDR